VWFEQWRNIALATECVKCTFSV